MVAMRAVSWGMSIRPPGHRVGRAAPVITKDTLNSGAQATSRRASGAQAARTMDAPVVTTLALAYEWQREGGDHAGAGVRVANGGW